MSWNTISANTIEHTKGYTITLLSGSWKNPMDIDTSFPRDLDAISIAGLIRYGLSYAASMPDKRVDIHPKKIERPKKAHPTRPILTLKKK